MTPSSLAAAWSHVRRDSTSCRFARAVLLLSACAGLCILLLNVLRRESYTGDEGFYGVTALNMLHSPVYWLRPSFYPQGDFLVDQDAFAHPPFNSYFYALSFCATNSSLAGPELVNVLAFVLLLGFSYRLLGLFDVRAGQFAVVLLVASPAILNLYSQLEAEPLLTTFGIIGLYCALRAGFGPGQRRFVFLSGLCLGMSFALKLWLFGPLALAIVASLILAVGDDVRSLIRDCRLRHADCGIEGPLGPSSQQAASRNSQFRASFHRLLQTRLALPLLAFALGVVIPSALHLAAIACWYPSDLPFWLKNIYFGFFTGSGVSGTKTGGAGVPIEWVHPIWYYAAVLYRDHFFLLPIFLLGLGALLRDPQLKGRVLWALLAGVSGLLPLSLIKVKEPLYILTCTVFLYLLAGCCLAALARRLESGARIPAWSWRLAVALCAALMAMVLVSFARGRLPDKLTPAFVSAHTAVLGAFLLGCWFLHRQVPPSAYTGTAYPKTGDALKGAPRVSAAVTTGSPRMAMPNSGVLPWFIYAACALTAAVNYGHELVSRVPRDKTIARITQPYLAANAPSALSFIASNYKCYQFYLFRRGCYWHELPLAKAPDAVMAQPGFAHVGAFILDPDALQQPELAPWLTWLQAHTQEKTAELNAELGRSSGWRVFVR